jgi:hypothetical protein
MKSRTCTYGHQKKQDADGDLSIGVRSIGDGGDCGAENVTRITMSRESNREKIWRDGKDKSI